MRRTNAITPFGMQIKTAMIQQDMTTKELAERIGKTSSTVSEVISGKNNSSETRALIIQELGIEV